LSSSSRARTFGEAAIPSLAAFCELARSGKADPEGHAIGRSFSILRTLGEAVMPSSPAGLYWALASNAGMRTATARPVKNILFAVFIVTNLLSAFPYYGSGAGAN